MISPFSRLFPVVGGLALLLAVFGPGGGMIRGTRAHAEPPADATAWQSTPVPDVWKKPPPGLDGFGWYRCFVRAPASWTGRDLELFVESVDDARQVYFNGVQVGSLGEFPPAYRSGLGLSQRLRITSKLVRTDRPNVVALRTYQYEGRSRFNVAAPVLFGASDAIQLRGDWQYRAGDDPRWAKGDDDAVPRDAVFTKLESADDINRTLKKLDDDEGPLTISQSLKHFQLPDDLALELAVGEPDVRQPLSMKFDERGRLWVLQYLQYPNPAGLKMVSRDIYLRTVWDKVPPPPPNHFRGHDKITIHEDTDGDGRFDKHKTFIDGLNIATSFARGRGGLWVLNPPYLLFYADGDNDDVPDGDPEVHLEGFGLEDSHSVANSLRWGPDGWLYAAQGSTVTGNIKRPGLDRKPVRSMGQLIWRYHPESRRYEIFAEGGGNAFGVEIDDKGRIYSGHNGGNTRGFHYVQGGYFRKGFGKHGALSNPYAFGYFAAMGHADVPRFTHTFVIYQADSLPPHYRGKLFGVGPLQSHVVYSQIQSDRSSFKTEDLGHPIATDDTWFRPVDIQVGPDGAVYVADFYEQRIDHASHYQGRIHKSTGRIYRLKAKNAPAEAAFDLAKLSSDELVDLLSHPNKWHRQTALRLIADRRDPSIAARLLKNLENNTGQLALESLWALNLVGALDDELIVKTLDHDDPFVRLWTVRLACDDHHVSNAMARKLVDLAYREPHVQVRSQLACSARRLRADVALPIARQLLTRSQDADDIHMPLLLWWLIESKADAARGAILEMLSDRSLWEQPLVRDHLLQRLMRRYAMAGSQKDLLTCARLFQLAPSRQAAEPLMNGFETAYQGRSLTGLPDELLEALSAAGGGSLALRLRQLEPAAVGEALLIVQNEKAKVQQRIVYIEILGQIDLPRCVPLLLELAESSRDDALRGAALTALQSYQDDSIPTAALRLHNDLPDEVREVAQSLLVSRKSWTTLFFEAIDAGRIDPQAVPLPVVRRGLLHDDRRIAALVEKHWGDVQGATTAQMLQDIQEYQVVIAAGSGNPKSGKRLFGGVCGKCHILFGEGGRIGPELTAYKRDDLKNMLLNVVNPSIEIRKGFENFVVFTDDGRTLNGFVAEQDNRVVVLRSSQGQTTVLSREEIDEMHAIGRSIMPEGILKTFNDQQIRDLFAYLRAAQPLP